MLVLDYIRSHVATPAATVIGTAARRANVPESPAEEVIGLIADLPALGEVGRLVQLLSPAQP